MPDSRRRHLLVDAMAMPAYDLGPEHPFRRDRQAPLFDLIHTCGLVDPTELLETVPATAEQLLTAHAAEYIGVVQRLSTGTPDFDTLGMALLYGMGTGDNPIAPDQHDAAASVAGATLACAEQVMTRQVSRAFNPAGGLHHAMPELASGFCIYNDLVVGIRRARALGAERVLYVDFDVHHGDGVEYAFRDDPTVVTLSFHETPEVRWPFTGRVTDRGVGKGLGYSLNVPLASHTADDSWLQCVQRVLVPVAHSFRPDLILTQHGCDPHREDPLAELEVTTRAFHEAATLTRQLADDVCEGRWVATGGGGYQPYRVIPRAWSMVWAVMSDRAVPDRVDEGWRTRWQQRSGQPMPERFLDEARTEPRHEHAARDNELTVTELLASIEWLER